MIVAETEIYPTVKCVECGEDDEAGYVEPIKSNMVKRSLCFTCLFWTEYVERYGQPDQAVVDFKHYVIGDEQQEGNRRWRGFGGSPFIIRFFDGRVVRSTNLWHQGEIPERFRERMPNNAEFQSVTHDQPPAHAGRKG